MKPDKQLDRPPEVARHPHEQMLKLVAKGFYKELIKYGVKEPEILTVAEHLLDNVALKSNPNQIPLDTYNHLFRITDIQNDWGNRQTLGIGDVSLSPLLESDYPTIAQWTQSEEAKRYFYPRFPNTTEELTIYFQSPNREYFRILSDDQFVGIIGADQIDRASKKIEMRKLIGDSDQRGKGIGKRATFLFLFHTYLIAKYEKVFLHSLDVNLRNLTLNGKFGFYLEGVFFEDIVIEGEAHDVARMALSKSVWLELFS